MKIAKLLICAICIIFVNCADDTQSIKAGSICTIDNGEGKFGIVKVLVINDAEAHVKIYKNTYDERPKQVDLKTLSLGHIGDKDGFGIGHAPLSRKGFDNWKPKIVAFEEVTKADLAGYEMWKNQE
jgi:hypothetical protein